MAAVPPATTTRERRPVNIVRIALVASTFDVGGAERVTAGVVERLPADRFEMRLYFLHGAGAVGRRLFEAGFRGGERFCKHARDPRAIVRLWGRFRAFRPQVVFCIDHHDAMLFGRLAGLLAGARASVVASHSTGLVGRDGGPRRSFRPGDHVMMEFTSRVVAVTATHARYLARREGIEARRIAVIENGIDVASWPAVTPQSRRDARRVLGLGDDEHVVAMIAAMRPEKAHDAFLDAVRTLASRGTHIRALLAGDGERRAALERRAESLGIADRVEFLGVRDDVARLLHASDVAVLPSRAVVETLPLCVLEAMSTGVPVVASRVGSLPEIVEDGVTGWLIPPADPVELARRLEHIIRDPEGARRTAAEARERVVGRYTIERTAERYMALFEEVAAAAA